MKSIETLANLAADGTLTAKIPPIISPGEHQVVIVIEESGFKSAFKKRISSTRIDGWDLGNDLAEKCDEKSSDLLKREPLRFSAYRIGLISDDFTFRREDIYDDSI